ncbi:hypothetical protein BXY82_1066 [Gelidibacter sediminis]|uniref:Uncharacterized protein n=1 Tax=Gelidibacter sediminis TaxID=1608710 RepID=A0A4R7QA64_9FLAO|nr:hypothetical protein [Gelidibacter sediminis]TDU43650.1 hypothetical protein BXY82_1066 [Gelidibacter sediminis]
MAKILSVRILEVPEKINVGDNETDITVVTTIEFHELDILGNIEYCLHLFVYDVHGKIDPLIIVSNWDESSIVSIETTLDRRDDYLGKASVIFKADRTQLVINTPMALKLGSIDSRSTYYTRRLEVFATATPAIGRASKWSEPYDTQFRY